MDVASTTFKTAGRHPWRCRRTDRSRRAPANLLSQIGGSNPVYHLLEEHWVPIASCEHYSNEKARFLNRAPCEAVFQAVTGAGSTPSWASIVIWSK